MRDIAKAASVSVGNAYHYFPSKVAIVMAYYEQIQEEHEARAEKALGRAGEDLEARLLAVFETKLRLVAKDRTLLSHVASTAMHPDQPLSAFSGDNTSVRDRSIRIFTKAISPIDFGSHTHAVATALWVAHLGLMLYLVHDTSSRQRRTWTLLRAACKQMVPLLQLASLPIAAPVLAGAIKTLGDAKLLTPPTS